MFKVPLIVHQIKFFYAEFNRFKLWLQAKDFNTQQNVCDDFSHDPVTLFILYLAAEVWIKVT